MPARRKYDRNAHRRRFKKGRLTYRGKGAEKGSGHRAGEAWGSEKQIDPKSRVTKYSKNSPSFDEGVWVYKENMKGKDTNYWWQFGYLNDVPRASDPARSELADRRQQDMAKYHAVRVLENKDEDGSSLSWLLRMFRGGGSSRDASRKSLGDYLSKPENRPGERVDQTPPQWRPPGSLRSYHTPQLSEDESWWTAQFDVARMKVGGHRRIGPVKKESHLRAETSRDTPYTEEEKSKARGEHMLGKKQGDKKKKGKHKRQDKPRDEAGRFTAEASSRIKHDPETGRSEVEPWTPKGKATPFSDQDWWQGQEAIQFYGSDWLKDLPPPQGVHKPHPVPDKSAREQAFGPELSTAHRIAQILSIPIHAAISLLGGSSEKTRQKKVREQRWSPKDLGRAPQEPVHPPRPSPPQQYPPLPPKPRGGRVRRQSQQPPQQPAYAPAEAYSEDRPMTESADAYQGRLVAQYPSMYQPIQFGEKPPNLVLAEYMGRSCASCKHFKEKKGKEVDDQGRCSLYDYVVKARMTCDAWTPTKEQQDFRGPGVMLDRKGGDPQHGGTSQLSEPIQFYGVNSNWRNDVPRRPPDPPRFSGKGKPAGEHADDPDPDTRSDVDLHMAREHSFWDRLVNHFLIGKDKVVGEAERRRQYAEEQRKKRQGGGGGGGFRFQKPGAQVQPQSYSGGAATQPMPGRLRQRQQIAAMSEDDYFEGYEEHLLKTMPERYQ